MQHVLIIHEVADYAAWKLVFDRAAGIRHAAGERSYQVLRYESDPNKIVHFSVWTSTPATASTTTRAASTTRSAATPRTLRRLSTTAIGSLYGPSTSPILVVPTG